MRAVVAPFSLPLSVSVSVCFRWTLPGLLFLGDGRRLGRSGRLAGVGWAVSWSLGWVGVSGPVGGVLGASSPAGTSLPLRGAGRVVLLLGLCFSLLGWGWPVMPWAASAPAGR